MHFFKSCCPKKWPVIVCAHFGPWVYFFRHGIGNRNGRGQPIRIAAQSRNTQPRSTKSQSGSARNMHCNAGRHDGTSLKGWFQLNLSGSVRRVRIYSAHEHGASHLLPLPLLHINSARAYCRYDQIGCDFLDIGMFALPP